jgi:hypothetical protein
VADCDTTAYGSPADWRSRSTAAGPLGVFKGALQRMEGRASRQLYTKMPVIVESREAVTLSVPERLRHRVFLYYGHFLGRDGKPTTSILAAPGFAVVRFEPCEKPRSAWPGGIRVKGRRPVSLLVSVAGRAPIPLRLGRPKPLPEAS